MNEGIKKGDVMSVVVPSIGGDIAVTAYVLEVIKTEVYDDVSEMDYIMYGQNRLFRMYNTWQKSYDYDDEGCPIEEVTVTSLGYTGVIADYVVIPEVDEKLKAFEE